ncbi:hypothetical protein [Psychrobacillus vulpis]|uniref:Uncharacterized protein n=1 Tax=Psychrobacillus vulpis TaxID=2325572 RepID=A0A544TR67_9BACI|nr:hypothetical protein [Psychrobacillus vulpis]TQR19946.1 hypothetical protein FG384_09805 [Psychrobacillus vulpis]
MKNKLIFISFFIVLSIIGYLYWSTLQEQIELPSKQWSRSIPGDSIEGNFSKLQSLPEENGYTISLLDFKKLVVLSCDNDMKCEENRTIESLNTYKDSWSNQTDSYFIRDGTLIHSNVSSGEIEIANNVVNFSKTGDTLVYWTEDHNIVVLNSPLSSEKQQFKFDEPVSYATSLENQIFIVTENKEEELYTLYNLADGVSQLFQFNISSQDILSSIHIFQQTEDSYTLVLDKKIIAGGSSTKIIESATFDLSLNQSPTFTKLSFIESQTGLKLKNIQFPSFYQGQHGPLITFSSTFYDQFGEKVSKIFVANFTGNTIQANAVTKPGSRYERSVLLNEQTVAYFKMKGANRYLQYSSSDEVIKQDTNRIMEGDYKAASYALLTKFFNGFLLILFSFAWIIPTLLVSYGSMFLLDKMKFARTYQTAFIVHLIALLSLQMYFLYRFTSIENIVNSIPFITENWHFALLLIISSILSAVPLFILRYKISEDNFNTCVLYTTFMNLGILFLLIGPYII